MGCSKDYKNINKPKLPAEMTLNNNPINPNELPEAFATFFKTKVQLIINEQIINNSVHNGNRTIWTTNHHFMSIDNILLA